MHIALMLMKTNTTKFSVLLPILFSFYVMGFVDIAGVSVSFVKQDFGLSDKVANLIPMMVFLWFAVLSIPFGNMMNRTGRKKMVLWSAVITTVSMVLPLIKYNFPVILVCFALLGIGNTMLQVSLNPLMADVAEKKRLASMLSLGQFIKAIASTLGPILLSLVTGLFGSWKYIFPTYAVLTLISWIWLAGVHIDEQSQVQEGRQSVFSLLKDRNILVLFTVIMLSVGFEVGLITTVPKFLQESFGTPLERGGYACSLYYLARTVGTFLGCIILTRVSPRLYQIVTVALGVVAYAGFMLLHTEWLAFGLLICIGLFCANIFPVTLGFALQYKPEQPNEISSLMITGVAGGAILPPLVGILADATTQQTSLVIPLAALVYILIMTVIFKESKSI